MSDDLAVGVAPRFSPIRAVVDTSALVPARLRHDLQQAAQIGAFVGIWSPWITAELNRVLVWRWIKDAPPSRAANDLTDANERRCGLAAKTMMEWLLPSFELVVPLPPYPPAGSDGRHVYEGIEYLDGEAFLALLTGNLE